MVSPPGKTSKAGVRATLPMGIKPEKKRKQMANTDQHDFNYKLSAKGELQNGSKEAYGAIDLKTSKTLRDMGLKKGRGTVRASASFAKGDPIAPIDHEAATRKLTAIM